jgi:hypothetical protein
VGGKATHFTFVLQDLYDVIPLLFEGNKYGLQKLAEARLQEFDLLQVPAMCCSAPVPGYSVTILAFGVE